MKYLTVTPSLRGEDFITRRGHRHAKDIISRRGHRYTEDIVTQREHRYAEDIVTWRGRRYAEDIVMRRGHHYAKRTSLRQEGVVMSRASLRGGHHYAEDIVTQERTTLRQGHRTSLRGENIVMRIEHRYADRTSLCRGHREDIVSQRGHGYAEVMAIWKGE